MLGLHPHQLQLAQPAAGTLYAWDLEVAARLDIAGWFDSLIQH
jgi:hypothetical protein